jgi:hypothetical protein
MGESVELACSGAFARQGKWEQRPARFTAARSVAVNRWIYIGFFLFFSTFFIILVLAY